MIVTVLSTMTVAPSVRYETMPEPPETLIVTVPEVRLMWMAESLTLFEDE